MPGNASRNISYLRNWIHTKVMEIMIKPKAGLVCAGVLWQKFVSIGRGSGYKWLPEQCMEAQLSHGSSCPVPSPWGHRTGQLKVMESPGPVHGQRALTWPPARVRWWINLLGFNNLWVTPSPLFTFPAIPVTVWKCCEGGAAFFQVGLNPDFSFIWGTQRKLIKSMAVTFVQ